VGRNAANPVPLANAFALAIRMAARTKAE
jgi:hypothetical protein